MTDPAAPSRTRARLFIILAAACGLATGAHLDRALSTAFDAAAIAAAPTTAPIRVDKWERREYLETDAPVPCPPDAPVIVTIGQSNAANSVGHRFAAHGAVYEMHAGHCYHASGALAGADLTYYDIP